jgi:hypothetical protein
MDNLHKINIKKTFSTGLIIVLVSAKIILAKEYVNSIISDRLNDNWNPVSGELVKRYEISKIVKSYLLNKYDSFPTSSVLVFDNLNVWSFDKQYGIQYWYGDQTLKVFDINFLAADANGVYIKYNPKDQLEAYIMKPRKNRVNIDSTKLYYFKLEGSHLKEYNYQDLLSDINKTN